MEILYYLNGLVIGVLFVMVLELGSRIKFLMTMVSVLEAHIKESLNNHVSEFHKCQCPDCLAAEESENFNPELN